jgi:hypothetical protein
LKNQRLFDEKHQLKSTATAKVASLDRTMGLSQKFSTGSDEWENEGNGWLQRRPSQH